MSTIVLFLFCFCTVGHVTTLAGGGKQGFQDGVGRTARFNYPEGIAYDADYQVLYVVEFVSKLTCQLIHSSISQSRSYLITHLSSHTFI